ncbi:MAG: hypothetical protein EXS34_04560 [Lacunisphaera sp.]|nr:hypothetical protein [Lacunisphaera sp.]
MSAFVASPAPQVASATAVKAASQHTRPDNKLARVRTHRCEIRLTAAEHRELWSRTGGQELSTWLRALALAQPVNARRGRSRRHYQPPVRAEGSYAQQLQARALMSLAQNLGDLRNQLTSGESREEAAALLTQVRRQWEALYAHRDL